MARNGGEYDQYRLNAPQLPLDAADEACYKWRNAGVFHGNPFQP